MARKVSKRKMRLIMALRDVIKSLRKLQRFSDTTEAKYEADNWQQCLDYYLQEAE